MLILAGQKYGVPQMSYKVGLFGIIQGTTIGVIKGDTRSLDYSSNDMKTSIISYPKLKVVIKSHEPSKSTLNPELKTSQPKPTHGSFSK